MELLEGFGETVETGGLQSLVAAAPKEFGNIRMLDFGESDAARLQERQVRSKVSSIGGQGVRRQPPFRPEVG
jgi:hypothetical protein